MNRSQRRKLAKQKNSGTGGHIASNVPILKKMVQDEVVRSTGDIYKEAYTDGINDALLLMLTFPLEVLRKKYWTPEQFDDNIGDFLDDILKLYEDFQDDKITLDELREDLWQYGGIRLEKVEDE